MHVVIAVTIGVALFHLLPHQVLDAVVAGMFLVGAALASREAIKEARRETKRSWSGRWRRTAASLSLRFW